jgi:putative hydrolase of the HAD superfamily
MKQYEHIFFDLDHTLWDFEKNSNHTMRKVYEEFELAQKGISDFDLFYEKYHIINEEMWAQFRNEMSFVGKECTKL